MTDNSPETFPPRLPPPQEKPSRQELELNPIQAIVDRIMANRVLKMIVVCSLIGLVIYFALIPQLYKQFGWKLPGLSIVAPKIEKSDEKKSQKESERGTQKRRNEKKETSESKGESESSSKKEGARKESAAKTTTPAKSSTKSDSNNSNAKTKTESNQKSKSSTNSGASGIPTDDQGNPLGVLNEIRKDTFESTAGLLYTRGSEDGTRLKHVLQHATDNPDRDDHGVFEGGKEVVLAVIDEAYLLVKKGSSQVNQIEDSQRQVYDVNMKRRIGYLGGRNGKRKGFPAANYIRLVLEDNRIITAYPVRR